MDEAVLSILRELGLSEYEAKALYALFRLREADARKISEVSDVPRTKIYEILEGFARKGYLTEMDARPKRYAVRDPEKVLKRILREKKEKLEKMEKKIEAVGKLIPIESDEGRPEGNYVLKFNTVDDFLAFIAEELDDKSVIAHRRESTALVEDLPGKKMLSPFDIFFTKDTVYLPMSPLHKPVRGYTVVAFGDKHVRDVFQRWLDERRDL